MKKQFLFAVTVLASLIITGCCKGKKCCPCNKSETVAECIVEESCSTKEVA